VAVKKVVMAWVLVAGMALAADAQVTVRYTRDTSHSRLTVTYESGYGYGYGYGGYGYGGYGYGGWGYGGTYRPAVAPGVAAGAWHPWGAGYGVGYGSGGYYAGPVRPILDYYPGVVRSEPVPERSPENISAAALDQGRLRLRAGDYRGAVEDIRGAVVAEGQAATSEAWFAVALSIAGEPRNADKALRAALKHGFKGKLDLALRDDKEKSRVVAALSKAAGEGAAYTLALLGRPEALEKLAAQDVALKPLLP
jgi:hypothetical protein